MASIEAVWRKVYFVCSFISIVSAACYRPDGSAADGTYLPCNGSTAVSMCCRLGVSSNNGDACGSGSSYGLCGISGTQLWRESCTDRTWKSPSCLKLCINGTDDQTITACSDGSYCCGTNNGTCCDAGQGEFIVNDAVSNTSTAFPSAALSTTSSPTSPPTSSATSSVTSVSNKLSLQSANTSPPSTSTNTTTASTSTGLSSSATIGLSVEISLSIIAAAILAGIFWKRHQNTSRFREMAEADVTRSKGGKSFGVVTEIEATSRSELGITTTPHEFDGTTSQRAEMGAGGAELGYDAPWRITELPGSSRWKS